MSAVGMPANLLEHREALERYFSEARPKLSAFSFVSIFAWKDFFEFEIKKIGKNLCVFAGNEAGVFLYLPPLGKEVDAAVIEESFALMRERNQGKGSRHRHGVARVENVPTEQLGLFPAEKFKRTPKGQEYCYYRKDLVELAGNDYKSKRSDYNHFVKHYNADFGPFSPQDREECLALYDRWARRRQEASQKSGGDEMYRYMLEDNRRVHETVLENFELLRLEGRVVRVNGRIAGYTFGYTLTPDIFCVLFEVTDLDHKGLGVYIFSQFCDDPKVAGHAFINVMDDFGLENVQKTKMSFRPAILISSYVVAPKDI